MQNLLFLGVPIFKHIRVDVHLTLTDEFIPDPDAVPDIFVGEDNGVDQRHNGRAVRREVRFT